MKTKRQPYNFKADDEVLVRCWGLAIIVPLPFTVRTDRVRLVRKGLVVLEEGDTYKQGTVEWSLPWVSP